MPGPSKTIVTDHLYSPAHICITCLCVLFSISGFAQQQEFAPYTQSINNTEAQFTMVPVAAGAFVMGSDKKEKGRNVDEGPQHNVSVSAFWMSTHEITWDIYDLFVYRDSATRATNGVDALTGPSKPYVDMTFGMGKKGFPAVAMTQYNAIQFCKWLYMQTGIFYRLPTEAEWEYACRAGSTTAYHFGNDAEQLADYGWFDKNSDGKTARVGQKKKNKFGLYDMHGNVAEWTNDQYDAETYNKRKEKLSKDPVAEATKLYPHVLRGGSFADAAEGCRCATRKPSDPLWKRLDPQIPKSNWWFPEAPFVGIRLVRPLEIPSPEEIKAYYDKPPVRDY